MKKERKQTRGKGSCGGRKGLELLELWGTGSSGGPLPGDVRRGEEGGQPTNEIKTWEKNTNPGWKNQVGSRAINFCRQLKESELKKLFPSREGELKNLLKTQTTWGKNSEKNSRKVKRCRVGGEAIILLCKAEESSGIRTVDRFLLCSSEGGVNRAEGKHC